MELQQKARLRSLSKCFQLNFQQGLGEIWREERSWPQGAAGGRWVGKEKAFWIGGWLTWSDTGKTNSKHTALEIELIIPNPERRCCANVSFPRCIHKNNWDIGKEIKNKDIKSCYKYVKLRPWTYSFPAWTAAWCEWLHLHSTNQPYPYNFPIGIMSMMALPTSDKLGDSSQDKSHEHLVCLINTAEPNRKQPETSVIT